LIDEERLDAQGPSTLRMATNLADIVKPGPAGQANLGDHDSRKHNRGWVLDAQGVRDKTRSSGLLVFAGRNAVEAKARASRPPSFRRSISPQKEFWKFFACCRGEVKAENGPQVGGKKTHSAVVGGNGCCLFTADGLLIMVKRVACKKSSSVDAGPPNSEVAPSGPWAAGLRGRAKAIKMALAQERACHGYRGDGDADA